jgi:hypothetical protein
LNKVILLEWDKLAGDLESQARTVRAGEGARTLKDKVEEAISTAENSSASPDIMDRLDLLLIHLTEKSRDNICTNVLITIRNAGCGE